MRFAIASLILLATAACEKAAVKPSCHDRVATMTAHLAAPRSFAELHVQPASSIEIVNRLVPVLQPCKPAADVLAATGTLEGGVSKPDYLHDKLPPAFEACNCAADPDTVGPLFEQWFDSWSAPPP